MAVSLSVSISACSEGNEESGYAIPASLCGVPVKSELLEPFLPPGDHVSTERTFPDGRTERCTVTIDNRKVAIFTEQEWLSKTSRLLEVAPSSARRKAHGMTDRYLYSGIGAAGRTVGCTDPNQPDQRLFTIIQSFTPDREDAPTMKKLIKAYTAQVERSKACHPKRAVGPASSESPKP
ncbi:hypothetical protein [Streptomyces sp. G45]|uniref:hypothetical protein n=1 Tax=Streptomyces sp. G45 TaxID=3406627 RepID=UPI003C265FF4